MRQSANAFTLIELLVVVSIVALLVALLLPSLGKARGAARASVCNSSQRQLHTLVMTYATDWTASLPNHTYHPPSANYHQGWLSRLVAHRLLPTLPTFAVSPLRFLDTTKFKSTDVRLCPEVAVTTYGVDHNTLVGDYSHFAMPIEVTGYVYPDGTPIQWGLTAIKLGDIKKPTRTTSMMDGWVDLTSRQIRNASQVLNEDHRPVYRWFPGVYHPNYYSWMYFPNSEYRHLKTNANFVFMDGHGERRQFDPNDPYSLDPQTLIKRGGFGPLLGPIRHQKYDG